MRAYRHLTSPAAPVLLVGAAHDVAKRVVLSENLVADKRSAPFPSHGAALGLLEVHFASPAGGASKIRPRLYRDAACDLPLWEGDDLAWLPGLTTATDLAITWPVEVPASMLDAAYVSSTYPRALFAVFATDVGTITVSSVKLSFGTED